MSLTSPKPSSGLEFLTRLTSVILYIPLSRDTRVQENSPTRPALLTRSPKKPTRIRTTPPPEPNPPQNNWITQLPWVLLELRPAPTTADNVSPSERAFGEVTSVLGDFSMKPPLTTQYEVHVTVSTFLPHPRVYMQRDTYVSPGLKPATILIDETTPVRIPQPKVPYPWDFFFRGGVLCRPQMHSTQNTSASRHVIRIHQTRATSRRPVLLSWLRP